MQSRSVINMINSETWLKLATKPVLTNQAIHIIRAFIPDEFKNYECYWQLLNAEEKDRANRYKFTKDKNQSVLSRGILRRVIATYIPVTAQEVVFSVTKHGKLSLSGIHDNLKFNVSHSEQCILLAFTYKDEIGVDVEYPKNNVDFIGLAKRFFSATEYQELLKLSESERYIGFYNAWTRKEAYIKALGEGLSHPLDSFDVALLPNANIEILRIAQPEHEVKNWSLFAFEPYAEYFAACAIRRKINTIEFFDL